MLEKLRAARDDAGDRTLEVNIAVSSGDWNSLLGYVEREWAKKDFRSAQELLRAGQLAAYLGSSRCRDLIYAAAEKGHDSAVILAGCYGAAVIAGWEDDPKVFGWFEAAAALSGEQGPIQKMPLQKVLEQQPLWLRRETDTWDQLHSGALPMFGAGYLLNRSLVGLFLFPALANPTEVDFRRRGIVFAYCGNRAQMLVDPNIIALDATALLSFSLLGVTSQVLDAFETVVIAHSTLSWLFDERQRIQFHQPSRVKKVRELKRYIDDGVLKRLVPSEANDPTLAVDIGDDLASLLAEARDGVGSGQRLVVKPYPVHRVGSLVEEIVDLSDYSSCVCGCQDVVDALVRRGRLTSAEEKRARSYLAVNEKLWPHTTQIVDHATLFLDDVALTYFQHLGLLTKIHAAGFIVFISESESSDRDALLRYDSLAASATEILDELRQILASGITSGKIHVSPLILGPVSDVGFQVLRSQWREEIPDSDARARSEWLLELFDWRQWMHRICAHATFKRSSAILASACLNCASFLDRMPPRTSSARNRGILPLCARTSRTQFLYANHG